MPSVASPHGVSWWLRCALVSVAGLAAATAGCTHGSKASGPGPAATVQPDPAVCRDMASITSGIGPMLDRLQAGTESDGRFEQDIERAQELADQLYRDASPLAKADPAAFAAANDVAVAIDRVIYREDLLDTPAEVDPSSIAPARLAISNANQAIRDGTIPCTSSS